MTPPTLPHSLESERALVGAALISPASLHASSAHVDDGDFFHPALAAIWGAVVAVEAEGTVIDASTVAERMRRDEKLGTLRAHGGEAFLGELVAEVVSVENIVWHAKRVARRAKARRLIQGFQELAAAGYGGTEPAELIERAEEILLGNAARDRAAPKKLRELLAPVRETILARYEHKGVVTGIPTGFHRLDAMTSGFQPGHLVVVAARPSMGKTAFAMQIAERAAAAGIPALFFSCEMLSPELVERLLSSGAQIQSTRIRTGRLDADDWIHLQTEETRLAEVPLWIDDDSTTLPEIRSKARLWRARADQGGRLDESGHRVRALVLVDYLQLLSIGGAQAKKRGQNYSRENEVADLSRGLKKLAKELQCPVVALAQLNRSLESRSDKRPMLSDLRESGAIEQDADLIAFIYRDEVYNKNTDDKGVAEIIIGKQRSGPIGTARLAWLAPFTRFENLDEDPQEALGFGPSPTRSSAARPQKQRGAHRHPYAPQEDETP